MCKNSSVIKLGERVVGAFVGLTSCQPGRGWDLDLVICGGRCMYGIHAPTLPTLTCGSRLPNTNLPKSVSICTTVVISHLNYKMNALAPFPSEVDLSTSPMAIEFALDLMLIALGCPGFKKYTQKLPAH